MIRKHDNFAPNEYYHIYNRGVDKRIVFKDVHDYHRFMLLLYFCNSSERVDLQKIFREGSTFTSFTEIFDLPKGKPLVAIGAWCLMPNHFHLIMKEISGKGIIKFMQKLTTGYAMYFNKKYERGGSLFQGKFKSEHASEDSYLKYLFSYIHLNPVKLIPGESKWKEVGIKNLDKAKNFLAKYEYSNFNNYANNKYKYEKIIDKKGFPEYFPDIQDLIKEITEWLSCKEHVEVRPSQS